MQADTAVAHDGHGHNPYLAHHFPNYRVQLHAQRLGMWLFLATEILLFAGLFVAYTAFRYLYPETFLACSKHLEVGLGTLNTVILITSSLTVALAMHFAKLGQSKLAGVFLLITMLFALAFLAVKGIEYHQHFVEGSLPGKYYHFAEVQGPGASMFFTIYFFATGLHGIHVVIGATVLFWVMIRAFRGEFNSVYYTPVELGGLYWHLVDLVWIFLYPLLYLIG